MGVDDGEEEGLLEFFFFNCHKLTYIAQRLYNDFSSTPNKIAWWLCLALSASLQIPTQPFEVLEISQESNHAHDPGHEETLLGILIKVTGSSFWPTGCWSNLRQTFPGEPSICLPPWEILKAMWAPAEAWRTKELSQREAGLPYHVWMSFISQLLSNC